MNSKNNLRRLAAFSMLLAALLLSACSAFPSVEAVDDKGFVIPAFYDTSLHEGKLAVRYLNLESEEKSGDAILISTPDGQHHYLVDSGVPEGGPQIDEVLNKLGIDKLQGVINTHPHIDHIGGFKTLLYTKEIGTFYYNGLPHTTNTYREVHQLLKERQIPLQQLQEGERLTLSPDVAVEVMNPPAGTTPEKFDEWGVEQHNNHSLVLMLIHGDNRILLTGDLYKPAEYDLVERYGDKLQADLMHAPHHGDITSSSGTFIRTVNPEFAVFSANTLQSLDILKRYENAGIKVYTTGLNGHLLFVSDAKKLQAYPEKERETITQR